MQKLTKEQRDDNRRKEIVQAAKKCVAKNGFHAASVAAIAKEAGINVGQLYRYFESKEEIARAITEEVFCRSIKKMADKGFINSFFEGDKQDIKIMSEIHAEANRNPQIDKIMFKAEAKMQQWLKEQIKIMYPQLNDQEADFTEEILRIIAGGLFVTMMRKKSFDEAHRKYLADYLLKKLLPQLPQK